MAPSFQREAALRLLAVTGIWRSNYEPPALRLVWKLGIDVPPPHFAPFFASALVAGSFFGCLWGLFMWLAVWRAENVSGAASAVMAAVAGTAFGLAMASYYAYGRQKHRLPSWESLAGAPASA